MNKIIKIALSWVMVVLTLLLILTFSLEDADKSSSRSEGVTEDVLSSVVGEENVSQSLVDKYDLSIRKLAHFCIYMLLGFVFANAFQSTIKIKEIFTSLISIPCIIIYSLIDEFVYQSISSGRTPSFIDVLIDSAGGIIGIFVFFGLYILYFKVIYPKIKKSRHLL